MDAQLQLLSEKFERLGARLKVEPLNARNSQRVSVNVRRDRKGEHFVVHVQDGGAGLRLEAIDVRPRERHLLLLAAAEDTRDRSLPKQKFLCGHDERAWFVAAVPERRSASDVRTAMEALKPRLVIQSQAEHRVRFDRSNRRKNAGFVRQGEWFFVPVRRFDIPIVQVLRNEPLQRTGGKPHWAEFACRFGGELVYFSPSRNRAIVESQYLRERGRSKGLNDWRPMQRNAEVLVTGRISHPDHKTIRLNGWHRVVMNTEHESEAMRFVAFLD